MSKYSPEFKNLLVDMGMPAWMFRLDNPNAALPTGTLADAASPKTHVSQTVNSSP